MLVVMFAIIGFLYPIMVAGINFESLIALMCLVAYPPFYYYGYIYDNYINEKLKYFIRLIAAILFGYFMAFFAAVLIIQSKANNSSDTRNYIDSHPEYILTTFKK